MGYSFWFDTNKLGIVHCTYLGVSGYNFVWRPLFAFTNSVDPDEMPHYAAFHLGHHCLQSTHLEVSQIQRVKFISLPKLMSTKIYALGTQKNLSTQKHMFKLVNMKIFIYFNL